MAPAASADVAYTITLDMNECGVIAAGVTGTCVRSLQTWLNIFDQAGLTVDSAFGPATDAAVRTFQRNHGLAPDGRFGEHARNALRSEYQYMMANSVATPQPCNPATGVNCDHGRIEAGANGGLTQTIGCNLAPFPFDVVCDVYLQ